MSPTPEQRAERIVEQNFGLALWRPGNARTAEREIARAIRAAENAALGRAAKRLREMDSDLSYAADEVLSLKIKAPRKRKEER